MLEYIYYYINCMKEVWKVQGPQSMRASLSTYSDFHVDKTEQQMF